MGNLLPRDVLLFAGGDALAKYGTLVRRTWPADRGGEQGKEVFTRTGSAWAVGKNGLLVPHGANVPRLEWAVDPVTGLLQPYWLLEAAGTNLIENSDYEVDAVGSVVVGGSTLTRDATNVFSGVWALKVTAANVSASGLKWTKRDTTRIAAVATTTYTLSTWVFAPAAAVGKVMRLAIEWYDVGAALLSTSQVAAPALVAGWQRLSFTATAPANTVTAIPYYLTNSVEGVFDTWVDVPQFEASAFATSAIPTGTGAVTRNDESASTPFFVGPSTMAGGWMYARFLEGGDASSNAVRGIARVGDAANGPNNAFALATLTPAGYRADWGSTVQALTTTVATAAAIDQVVELLLLIFPDTSQQLRVSIQQGADLVAVRSGVLTAGVAAQFAAPTLWIGALGNTNTYMSRRLRLSRLVVGTGAGTAVATLADARAVIP